MNKLELLWELEIQNIILDDIIKKRDDFKKENMDRDTEEKTKKTIRSLEILDNNIGVIKTAVIKYENTLSQYEYEIKVLDDKLYKDNITDIKQLEYLGFEKEQLNKELRKIESEMMAYMEEEEILEKKHSTNTIILKELEKKTNEDTSKLTKELETLESLLKEKEKEIEEIVGKLDTDSLRQYNSLRERKDKPIVNVRDNICLGCYMKVPMYQLEDLRKRSDLINCESCGRILYLRDK